MATLTCPNCGRDVEFNGSDAEAICAACPLGGADGDTHFDAGADANATPPVSTPDDSDIEHPADVDWKIPHTAADLPVPPTPNPPVRPEEPSA